MMVSKLALAISLAAGSTAASAVAQESYSAQPAPQQPPEVDRDQEQRSNRRNRNQQQQPPQQPAGPALSREERALIQPLEAAIQAQNWEAANAALAAAQAGVQSPYGRFFVGSRMLQIGQGTSNLPLQVQAVEAMIASGGAPADMAANLVVARARLALQMRDWPVAERILTQIVEASPNDVERLWQLAEVKIQLEKNAEALVLYQRLLQASAAAGQTPPEERIKRALDIANVTRDRAAAAALGQQLIRAYPTRANWNQVLAAFRSQAGEEAQYALDVRRLMRAAGAFSRQEDYLEFAGRLTRAGQPGEVKAVLDEGTSRGTVPATDAIARQMLTSANTRIADDQGTLPALRTRALAAANGRDARIAGDTFYGYGQYPQAIELYRAALQKGGEDANLVNIRLGAALVAANQAAEAQAAFRAVTGNRAALAALWLLWLERRPS